MHESLILRLVMRLWIPLVIVVVLVVGGYAVLRIRGIFGSHQLQTYAGSMSDDDNHSDPKRLTYQIFGPAGTIADINYIDEEGQPHQVNSVSLPWEFTIITTAPAVTGNIVAQGDSDFIGCRITADGKIKDERSANAVNAYIYCFVKAA